MNMQTTDVEEMDAFDRFVDSADRFFRRYLGHLVRWLPPAIGFLLFLAYFTRNHFYPSFDLFQFSSLLLSAAAIGFVFVGALTLGIAAPGLILVHGFASDVRYKGLLRHRNGSDKQRDRHALQLLLLCFVLPCAVASLVLSALLLTLDSFILPLHLTSLALIALGFGIAIQMRFALPKWSFLHYFWAGSLALLIVNALALGVLSFTSTLGWVPAVFQPAAITATLLIISVVTGLFTAAAFGSLKTSLSFSVPIALALALYSGALSGMPERVMGWLGLGNYKASEIVLDAEYCQPNPPERLSLDTHCVMKDTQVVWSLGESLVVRVAGEKELQVQIPSRYVKAIIRTLD